MEGEWGKVCDENRRKERKMFMVLGGVTGFLIIMGVVNFLWVNGWEEGRLAVDEWI